MHRRDAESAESFTENLCVLPLFCSGGLCSAAKKFAIPNSKFEISFYAFTCARYELIITARNRMIALITYCE
jgi:hypothetical protein